RLWNQITFSTVMLDSPETFSARRRRVRLSLSQRERIKVRDCCDGAPRAHTRSLAKRCRVLRALDYSKIGRLGLLFRRGTFRASDHVFAHYCNYALRHLIRPRALQPGNKSRGSKDQPGVVGGICNGRSYGSAGIAKESAQSQLLSCEASERGSLEIDLVGWLRFREVKLIARP